MNINTDYLYSSSSCREMVYDAVLKVVKSEETGIEPVTVQEAKLWCAIDGDEFNSILTTLIGAAREMCEDYVNLSMVERTVEATVRAGTKLPYGTVLDEDVTGITYLDLTEVTDTLYKDLYAGTYIVTYPVTPDTAHSNKFKAAILNQVAYMYEHRGDEKEVATLSPMAKSILKPLRVI